MTSVRVAVIDHQPVFSRALELLLPALTESRVRVVASTDDAAAASMLVRRHRPDLALVDVDLPAPGGMRAIAAIGRTEPDVPVIAMGDGDSDAPPSDRVIEALRAGAEGFMLKTGEPESLVPPLLAVLDGAAVVPRGALRRLLSTSSSAREGTTRLTEEEREVWRLIASGCTTPQMAGRLHVSERTAKRLTAAVLRRLGAASRIEAAMMAGHSGVVQPRGTGQDPA